MCDDEDDCKDGGDEENCDATNPPTGMQHDPWAKFQTSRGKSHTSKLNAWLVPRDAMLARYIIIIIIIMNVDV